MRGVGIEPRVHAVPLATYTQGLTSSLPAVTYGTSEIFVYSSQQNPVSLATRCCQQKPQILTSPRDCKGPPGSVSLAVGSSTLFLSREGVNTVQLSDACIAKTLSLTCASFAVAKTGVEANPIR